MSAALAKLHIAKKELGLDDPTYRTILQRLTGQESAKGLSEVQIGVVLDELKAKGWTPKASPRAGPKGPSTRAADHPVAKKARALWISLWDLGEVRDPSEAALEAFARRQLGCERMQWSDQGLSYKLIEALKAWGGRAGWKYPANSSLSTIKSRLLSAQYRRLIQLSIDEPIHQCGSIDGEIGQLGILIRRARSAP